MRPHKITPKDFRDLAKQIKDGTLKRSPEHWAAAREALKRMEDRKKK